MTEKKRGIAGRKRVARMGSCVLSPMVQCELRKVFDDEKGLNYEAEEASGLL
jgi:hypothetical protein